MPDKQWGIVMLTNSDNGFRAARAIWLKLMDDALGIREDERQDVITGLEASQKVTLDSWRNARDNLLPDVPEPPVQRSLPLESCTERYWNDAFRDIELRLEAPREYMFVKNGTDVVLRADWKRFANSDVKVELEWVSGEQFVAWINFGTWSWSGYSVPAEFKIDNHGQVRSLGMYLDPDLFGQNTMMWFDKVGVDETGSNGGEL